MRETPETPETTETAKTPAPRCGHETKSGPCVRPEGHTPNGHMSKAVLDAKTANFKAKKSGDPEAIAAREARDSERLAKRVERLEVMAAELGYKIVALPKRSAKKEA